MISYLCLWYNYNISWIYITWISPINTNFHQDIHMYWVLNPLNISLAKYVLTNHLTRLTYHRIKLNNGTVIKWHVDHIRIQHSPQQHHVHTNKTLIVLLFQVKESPITYSNSKEPQTVPESHRSTRWRQPTPVRFL